MDTGSKLDGWQSEAAKRTHIAWRRAFKQMDREWRRVSILMFVLGVMIGVTLTVFVYATFGG